MQPGRGVESLHVPGDSLPRALWWGCEEAPPRSGEDVCWRIAHVPQLWGQVCGPGVRSNPSAEGWGHQRTVVRWGLWITDLRVTDYITNSLYVFMCSMSNASPLRRACGASLAQWLGVLGAAAGRLVG